MKICYVAPDTTIPSFKGSSTHVSELARHLAMRGHILHLVTRRLGRGHPEHEVVEGLHVHRLYRGILAPLSPASVAQEANGSGVLTHVAAKSYEAYLRTTFAAYVAAITAALIRRYRIDVILERETSFGAGTLAGMVTKRPVVLEIIGPRYPKYAYAHARRVMAYTRRMIRYGFDEEKVLIVSAGANTDLFKPDPDARAQIRSKLSYQDEPVIGYVGTFPRWHGLQELVRAAPIVLAESPRVRFMMVGPNAEWLQQIVSEAGLSDAFTFVGSVPYERVPSYINAADIVVAPYNPGSEQLRREFGIGSPLKVIEYLACAKPVITTAVEPITSIVEDKVDGLLVPPGDPAAQARAALLLLTDTRLASSLAQGGNRKALRSYSWANVARQIETALLAAVGVEESCRREMT